LGTSHTTESTVTPSEMTTALKQHHLHRTFSGADTYTEITHQKAGSGKTCRFPHTHYRH